MPQTDGKTSAGTNTMNIANAYIWLNDQIRHNPINGMNSNEVAIAPPEPIAWLTENLQQPDLK